MKTDFDGVITGVNYSPEGPVLLVGNQSIKLKDVKKIVDPGLKQNDQNIKNVTGQDLKKQTGKADTELDANEKGAMEEVGKKPTIFDNVGMSRDIINKLAKETKPDAVKVAEKEPQQVLPKELPKNLPAQPQSKMTEKK